MTSVTPFAGALNKLVTAAGDAVKTVATNHRPVLRGATGSSADLLQLQAVNRNLLGASSGLQDALKGTLSFGELSATSRSLLEDTSRLLTTRHAAALIRVGANDAADLTKFGAQLYDEASRLPAIAQQAWKEAL